MTYYQKCARIFMKAPLLIEEKMLIAWYRKLNLWERLRLDYQIDVGDPDALLRFRRRFLSGDAHDIPQIPPSKC